MRANEYKIFVDNQKTLLQREKDEEKLFSESSKRLKTIQKEIKKNNDWLVAQ